MSKHVYKIKPTKKQLKVFKKYWKELEEAEDEFYGVVRGLEIMMSKETGIEGVEFFSCDGAYVGVGNEARTMKLVQIR